MVSTSDYIANYPYRVLGAKDFPVVVECESALCNSPAIGYCDRCGNRLCGMCSHPTTPKTIGHLLCNPWCLYDPAQLWDYGY